LHPEGVIDIGFSSRAREGEDGGTSGEGSSGGSEGFDGGHGRKGVLIPVGYESKISGNEVWVDDVGLRGL
jgi:hypothetical protein